MMVRFVNAVMIERRGRLFDALLAIVLSVGVVAVLFLVVTGRIDQETRTEAATLLDHQIQLEQSVDEVFAKLKTSVVAQPCSQTYREQLHRIAYLPDGVSEFFHVLDGWVICSLNIPRFAAPVDLGMPDTTFGAGHAIWINRDLAAFDLAGMTGSIVTSGEIGFIVPPQSFAQNIPTWLDLETVLRSPNGLYWHWDGTAGVYAANSMAGTTRMRGLLCDNTQQHCAAFRVHPARFLAEHWGELALCALILGGIAVILAVLLKIQIRRYCSFESRFRRHLNADTVVCSYQPVMDLRSGEIVGCEVLARWRDVDGQVVMPDRFIPLVERDGLTLEFTRSIVEKAMWELSTTLPKDVNLNVAFNVFPRDLADKDLPAIFGVCRRERDRFSIIAEIVESAAFAADEARAQIEALRSEGVGVYLDDFGAGYSNIQNLAALPVEGVKLDRAFAMAPDDSLMARMLTHAIGLINVSGRVIVVEGVETAGKIDHLRGMGSAVDRVQGYHIARPMPIGAFAEFLASGCDRTARLPAAA